MEGEGCGVWRVRSVEGECEGVEMSLWVGKGWGEGVEGEREGCGG